MRILAVFLTCISLSLSAKETIITSDNYLGSAYFNFSVDGKLVAQGKRSGMIPPYTYCLFNTEGDLVATGKTKFFAAGCLFTCSENLDMYTREGFLGRMSGTMWTTARSRYRFYDPEGREIAVAYLGFNQYRFTLVSQMEGRPVTLATLQARVKKGVDRHLHCETFDTDCQFDERALYLFGMFALDFASSGDFTIPKDPYQEY